MSYQENYTRTFGSEDEVRRRRRAFVLCRKAEKEAGDIMFHDEQPPADFVRFMAGTRARVDPEGILMDLLRSEADPEGSLVLAQQRLSSSKPTRVFTGTPRHESSFVLDKFQEGSR